MPADQTGEPDGPNQTDWADDDRLFYKSGQLQLTLNLSEPHPVEIEAVTSGCAELGLCTKMELPCTMLVVPDSLQSYAFYHYALVPKEERIPPLDPKKLSSSFRVRLLVTLKDYASNTVATREIYLDSPFSRALHEAICRQADHPFVASAYKASRASFCKNFRPVLYLSAPCLRAATRGCRGLIVSCVASISGPRRDC